MEGMRITALLSMLLLRTTSVAPAQNIIYILADDLGYHELGSYGQEKIRTPNLDRIAAEGMRFTRHYSGSPVCAPSRCVLMTGRHTGHASIRGNKEVGGWGPEEPEGQWPLPADDVTIAEMLSDAGYHTGAFGKWGLGGPGSEGHPNNQGFDHFYGYLCQRVAHNYYPTHLWRNHDVDVLHGNRHFRAHQRIAEPFADLAEYERYRGEDYAPEAIINEALDFVRRNHEAPFFLYYGSVIPHVALQAPAESVEAYPTAWDPVHYLGDRGYLPTPRPRATYAAMISYLDANVGRLLDLLDELGIADDTIVMFSSDNGTTFNGGCDRAFFNSLGDLRGTKCTVYEGGLRVPMLVRWPGVVEPGSTTGHVSAFQDVLPTLAAITGADVPAAIDGISFLPTLRGDDAAQRAHDHLYWEYPERRGEQAVIWGRYKGVRRALHDGELAVEVYDLEADPAESTDLASSLPEVAAKIEALMRASRHSNPLFPIAVLDTPE